MTPPVLYGVHDSTGMQQGPGLVPTIYVDTVQFRYLVCAGKAKSIDYVYVGDALAGSIASTLDGGGGGASRMRSALAGRG